MSMLDGVSQCWWLSSACRVDWAAWAAIAAGFAALAALLVGLGPIWLESRRRTKQAKVLAQVLADELAIQELYLRAAIGVPRDESGYVTAWEYREVSSATSVLNPQPVMDLISFSPNLPSDVIAAIAQCSAMLSIAKQRRIFLADPVLGKRYSIAGDAAWYQSVARDIHSLRLSLHKWIGTEPQKFEDDIVVLSENLRAIALTEQLAWDGEQFQNAVKAAKARF